MDFNDGYVSKEHLELHRSASESVDPVTVSPLQLSSPKSPRSPKAQVNGSNSSPKNNRQSHSSNDGRPKKGGVFFYQLSFHFSILDNFFY